MSPSSLSSYWGFPLLCVCVCVCVCLLGREYTCVCMCVYTCVRTWVWYEGCSVLLGGRFGASCFGPHSDFFLVSQYLMRVWTAHDGIDPWVKWESTCDRPRNTDPVVLEGGFFRTVLWYCCESSVLTLDEDLLWVSYLNRRPFMSVSLFPPLSDWVAHV